MMDRNTLNKIARMLDKVSSGLRLGFSSRPKELFDGTLAWEFHDYKGNGPEIEASVTIGKGRIYVSIVQVEEGERDGEEMGTRYREVAGDASANGDDEKTLFAVVNKAVAKARRNLRTGSEEVPMNDAARALVAAARALTAKNEGPMDKADMRDFSNVKDWLREARKSRPTPFSAARAKEIIRESRGMMGSNKYEAVMTQGEYRYAFDIWGDMPGNTSFNDAMLRIAQGRAGAAKEMTAFNKRDLYRPKGDRYDDIEEVKVPDGLDLEIWKYTIRDSGKLVAVAFQGRSQKPLWMYSFGSESRRDNRIEETIKSRGERLDEKKERQEERRNFRHTLQEGDFLSSSWGYDQTNVDFYQVIAISEKSVKIRQVANKVVKTDGTGDEHVVPAKNKFIGSPMNKRVGQGNNVRINSHSSASPWDGRPMYETGPYGGH